MPGINGEDGKTSYLHIKYSDNGGLSFTANNGEEPGAYIGQYVDFIQKDSDNPTDYTWSLIKGESGAAGSDATTGEYYEYRYAKNGSTVSPPALDADAENPAGWSTEIPSVGTLEYVWCTMAKKSGLSDKLALYIPVNSGETTTLNDSVDGLKATLSNGASVIQDGSRYAMNLSQDGECKIPYDLPFGQSFTLCFWMKTDQTLIRWMLNGYNGREYVEKSLNVSKNTWFHVALRFNDRTVSVFINGSLAQTGSINEEVVGFSIYDDNMFGSSVYYDDVKIYNGALSATDIGKVKSGESDKLIQNWCTPFRINPYDGKDGKDGVGVNSVDVEYAKSTSNKTAPTSGWQTTAPTWEDGKYIWSRTKTVLTDGSTEYTKAVCITGGKGETGDKGDKGDKGDSPVMVYRGDYSSSKTYYGNKNRLDAVKYNNQYYIARIDADTFSNVVPTNTSKWNPFGAQFESIATNLLLAEGASIGDWFIQGGKIVSTLGSGNKITLDASMARILIESSRSGGDYSEATTQGSKITIDANNGTVEARSKSNTSRVAYMSPTGIFCNNAETQAVALSTGITRKAAIVGIGYGNVSSNIWDNENMLAGIYGYASNSGNAPEYGGYFQKLMAAGLFLSTKIIDDNDGTTYLSETTSLVIGYSSSDKSVYLPNDGVIGRIIFSNNGGLAL